MAIVERTGRYTVVVTVADRVVVVNRTVAAVYASVTTFTRQIATRFCRVEYWNFGRTCA